MSPLAKRSPRAPVLQPRTALRALSEKPPRRTGYRSAAAATSRWRARARSRRPRLRSARHRRSVDAPAQWQVAPARAAADSRRSSRARARARARGSRRPGVHWSSHRSSREPAGELDLAKPFDRLMQGRADGPALDLEVVGDLVVGEAVVVASHDDRPLPVGQLSQRGKEVDAVRRGVEAVVTRR